MSNTKKQQKGGRMELRRVWVDEKGVAWQPLVMQVTGEVEFHPNAIVQLLFERGAFTLDVLSRLGFSQSDWHQFLQLIGTAANDFCQFPFVSPELASRVRCRVEEVRYASELANTHKKPKRRKTTHAKKAK